MTGCLIIGARHPWAIVGEPIIKFISYVNTLLSTTAKKYKLKRVQVSNVADVPTQGILVVDCGVAVIYMMKQLYNAQKIKVNLGLDGFRMERATLVHTFLNYPPRSSTMDTYLAKKLEDRMSQ